jgi:hypothetical protein
MEDTFERRTVKDTKMVTMYFKAYFNGLKKKILKNVGQCN